MIKAEILADSKSVRGERITTFLLTFPRIILAEFNTHRAFSRNSASSRAIPFAKMVESVETNPFIPIAWQKHHKGMQGNEYWKEEDTIEYLNRSWVEAIHEAVNSAKLLDAKGVTKQLCNRILEPFMWHTVICTATDYENFFKLRCPSYYQEYLNTPESLEYSSCTFRSRKDYIEFSKKEGIWYPKNDLDWFGINESQAEIHIQALAEAMWDAMNESTPKVLEVGQLHVPFGGDVKIATARCARVSYTTVGSENKSSDKADIELYNKLLESGHMSPFEHCAQVMCETDYTNRPWSRNFKGFMQYRELVEREA